MSTNELLYMVKRVSDERRETDRRLSKAWIPILLVLGVATYISVLLASFALLFSLLYGLFALISVIVFAVFIYRLVKRRDEHFRRQRRLFNGVLDILDRVSKEKNIDISDDMTVCNIIMRDINSYETGRGAGMWAFLSIIPLINVFAILYIYYFLMNDFYSHERREDELITRINNIFEKLELVKLFPRENRIPKRSFALYLVLTVITLGIFGIYWTYVLIEDPNNHFKNHELIETQLISEIDKLIS